MKYKILIIFHTLNNDNPSGDPSIWHRCINFKNLTLNKNVEIKLLNQKLISHEFIEEFDYSEFDFYIFFRPVANEYFSRFLMNCSKFNKKFAASYDDLTFLMSSWKYSTAIKSGQRRSLVQHRYGKAADAFDCFDNFIVSSQNLADHISRIKQSANVVNIENVLPKSYQLYTEYIHRKVKKENLIGYFGGGISHSADLNGILDIVSNFCKVKNVKLLCPSYLLENIQYDLKDWVIPFPRISIAKMLELYGLTRINLAPLVLDENSNAKSSIKYIESISSYAPLVASPLASYEPYLKQKSLHIVDNYSSWRNSIETAWDESMNYENIKADRTATIKISSKINSNGFKKIIQWMQS